IHGYSSERLCCRFETTSARLDRHEVLANIDGCDLHLAFLTHLGEHRWEANISPPRDLQRGEHQLRLRIRNGGWSDAGAFTLS
ncbi:MAG: hypothetical protein M3N93_01710, partial [Acidobacteriota bacterium]|nr:hypothetical protein [Acidobacteriota bacterium]